MSGVRVKHQRKVPDGCHGQHRLFKESDDVTQSECACNARQHLAGRGNSLLMRKGGVEGWVGTTVWWLPWRSAGYRRGSSRVNQMPAGRWVGYSFGWWVVGWLYLVSTYLLKDVSRLFKVALPHVVVCQRVPQRPDHVSEAPEPATDDRVHPQARNLVWVLADQLAEPLPQLVLRPPFFGHKVLPVHHIGQLDSSVV